MFFKSNKKKFCTFFIKGGVGGSANIVRGFNVSHHADQDFGTNYMVGDLRPQLVFQLNYSPNFPDLRYFSTFRINILSRSTNSIGLGPHAHG